MDNTSNPTACEGGVVGSDLQHSATGLSVPGILTKTQKRKLRRRTLREKTLQLKAILAEKEANVGKKRQISDSSTQSPSDIVKKPRKKFSNGPFAHTTKNIKLSIVKEDFPAQKLCSADVDAIRLAILKNIDLTPKDEHLPKIRGSSCNAGALILECEDKETTKWVRRNFHNDRQIIHGTTLRVVSVAALPKPVKVAFKTRDVYTKEPSDLLRRLSRFNPELKSKDWRVLQRQVEPQSIRWIFKVNWENAEAIKRADFGAYTGVDRGIFKIFEAPNNSYREMVEEDSIEESPITSTEMVKVPLSCKDNNDLPEYCKPGIGSYWALLP